MASTYPLEIIQLEQWLQKNPDLKGDALTTSAQKLDWNPSIQSAFATYLFFAPTSPTAGAHEDPVPRF